MAFTSAPQSIKYLTSSKWPASTAIYQAINAKLHFESVPLTCNKVDPEINRSDGEARRARNIASIDAISFLRASDTTGESSRIMHGKLMLARAESDAD